MWIVTNAAFGRAIPGPGFSQVLHFPEFGFTTTPLSGPGPAVSVVLETPASGPDDKLDHPAYDVLLADATARGPCIWTTFRVPPKLRRRASRMCS